MWNIQKYIDYDTDKPVYNVMIDSSTSCGILHFSHELSLDVTIDENGECYIHDGWEMNCGGDWSWEPGEEKAFEDSHPGLLKELSTQILLYENEQSSDLLQKLIQYAQRNGMSVLDIAENTGYPTQAIEYISKKGNKCYAS